MGLPISYHWRSLMVRKTTSLLTMLVVAAVGGVFTWILGFGDALERSLLVAADERKLIVLKPGATSETNSAIPVDDFHKLNQVSRVATDPAGRPLISPEILMQVWLPRLRDGGKTTANVAVRGVTDIAFQVHRNVRLLGSSFSAGVPEVIVGATAAKQFAGLNVGAVVNLGYGGDRGYRVVGHFTADGGPMESEIWAYLPSLMNSYQRTMYSSAEMRLRDDADPTSAIEQIEGPAIELSARTEAEYWRNQTDGIRGYAAMVHVLVLVMSAAAIFSITNTVFTLVAGRTREVAMLRTIGYRSRHILSGFILEAVILSVLGGVIGCLGCAGWLAMVGNTKDMFASHTFTVLAFEITMTARMIGISVVTLCLAGMIGAIVPAARAARLHVVEALREP